MSAPVMIGFVVGLIVACGAGLWYIYKNATGSTGELDEDEDDDRNFFI